MTHSCTFLAPPPWHSQSVVWSSGSPGQDTVPRGNPSSQRSKIPRTILNTNLRVLPHWVSQLETGPWEGPASTNIAKTHPLPLSIYFWLRFPPISSQNAPLPTHMTLTCWLTSPSPCSSSVRAATHWITHDHPTLSHDGPRGLRKGRATHRWL